MFIELVEQVVQEKLGNFFQKKKKKKKKIVFLDFVLSFFLN